MECDAGRSDVGTARMLPIPTAVVLRLATRGLLGNLTQHNKAVQIFLVFPLSLESALACNHDTLVHLSPLPTISW